MAQEKTLPPPPERPDTTPQHVFRRRQISAAIVALALLALLIGAIASHGSHSPKHARPPRPPFKPTSTAVQRQALLAKREGKAIDSVLAYTPVVVKGGEKGKEVALTFDDGPGPYSQRLLATLNKLKVHATFFTVGNQEQYFSAATTAEAGSGEAVEDHSETHPMMASLSPHDQYEQLFESMARIELEGAARPRLFRPPYGSFDATTFKELHHLHLLMVLWSVDTGDYAQPGVEAIVQRALAGATPGAIILMHDAGGDRSETIAALPKIVAGLRKRGLVPVTVPKLLLDDPPPPGQKIPTSLTGG